MSRKKGHNPKEITVLPQELSANESEGEKLSKMGNLLKNVLFHLHHVKVRAVKAMRMQEIIFLKIPKHS